MKVEYRSEVGKRGQLNEDSVALVRNDAVYESKEMQTVVLVVADGVGGHNAGEVASYIVTTKVAREMSRIIFDRNQIVSAEKIAVRFQEVIGHVNREIFDKVKKDSRLKGMGTTVTAAVILGSAVHIGHVGDSRAYIINKEEINQITKDHSLVQERVDEGKITKEEARTNPERHKITRAVGVFEQVKVDTLTQYIYKDDHLLLCSDGLTDVVTDQEIHEVFKEGGDVQKICDTLVKKAHSRHSTTSVSVIVAKFDKSQNRKEVQSEKTRVI